MSTTPETTQYLVIGIGEQYDSKICAEQDLLKTVIEMMFCPSGSAPEEEVEYWRKTLADEDEWISYSDTPRAYFHKSVGEDDGITIYKILASRAGSGEHSDQGGVEGVPVWIVNDSGELGVRVGNRAFFLYKGENIEYEDGKHDDGTPILFRRVGKREFGETVWPESWMRAGRSQWPYTVECPPGIMSPPDPNGEYQWKPLLSLAAPSSTDEAAQNH